MNARSEHTPWHRMPRAWARLALASAAAAGTFALAVSLLLEDEDARGPRHVPGAPVVVASAPPVATPAPTTPAPGAPPALTRPRPASLSDVARQDATIRGAELGAWVQDAGLDPQTRYAALRRLELADPSHAVAVAIAVLADTTPLVRLNAIALLSRSQDPRAVEALARLDERSRRLASQLARR